MSSSRDLMNDQLKLGLNATSGFPLHFIHENVSLPNLEMCSYGNTCHTLVPKHLFLTKQCQVSTTIILMPPTFSSLTSGTSDENRAPSVPLQHIYKLYSLSYHENRNIILFFSDFKMLSFWNIFNSGIILSTEDGTWYSKGNVKAAVEGL
jgi:hypothetical protein